ncbi:MAG: TIGR04283 family arsenosugar biosynthesis glycosyltransferase [Pseudomonadota bacterium]
MKKKPARTTAVVPALNEETALPRTLSRLRDCGFDIIVVDGGSLDRTAALAGEFGRVLSAPPGRARQMNLGAAAARGEFLFFVHADSRPPLDADNIIRRVLSRPGIAAGAFHLRIDSPDPRLKIISGLANLRSRCLGLPYGDQGLFLSRKTFQEAGGFPDIPLMEDVEMVRRLKTLGRVELAPGEMVASARRWDRRGPFKNSAKNVFRLARYYLGVSPEKLAAGYRNER